MSSLLSGNFTAYLLFFALILLWVFRVYQDAIESTSSGLLEWTGASVADTLDEADAALVELCEQTQWTEGLWLSCHSGCGPNQTSSCGGLNNARNRFQTCLRLAIDIGAGVKFSRVTDRSEHDLLDTGKSAVTAICPSAWWNMDALATTMGTLCPQMRISTCDENPPDIPRLQVVALSPRKYKNPPHHTGTFSDFVTADLAISSHDGISSLDAVTHENPLLLRFEDPYLGWDYRASDELQTLRKALFRALPFNSDLLALSDAIRLSPALQQPGGFVAVHLRAEGDWPSLWGTPARQMEMHAAQIIRSAEDDLAKGLPVATDVYVSCGDRATIQTFREMMAPDNFTVHDKWTLLEADQPAMLEVVDQLTFDQKGAVEYNVLVGGRYFQGNLASTLSTLVVYARTMDQPADFFETWIYPNTERVGMDRVFAEALVMKGDASTKLFVVNGMDIMDNFP